MMTTRSKIGVLEGLIILLTLATAAIHISLLFPDVVFILNGWDSFHWLQHIFYQYRCLLSEENGLPGLIWDTLW